MGERLVVTSEPVREAAKILSEAIAQVDRELGFARLGIPGGSALEVLRHVPALLPPGVWSRLRLTWVDERCVDLASDDSNRGTAYRQNILSKDNPVGRELPLWEDGDTPERAMSRFVRRFEAELSSGLDVTLLGLGPDGHIASLFPGHPARFSTAAIAYVKDSPKPPPERLTLTFKSLRTARTNVLYAVSEKKRQALEQVLAGDPLAAANVLPGDLVIVTDLPLEKKR